MADISLPSADMNFVGDGDFTAVGEHFFAHFVNLGGLRPHHRVLDVGSGIGRMALPLTRYLTTGGYEGFDIVNAGVQWCQHHITPKFPNFRFRLADVNNRYYNPRGRYPAAGYRFPFPSARFDFVFLTSVFTHMMPDDLENYVSEIARVLRTGGRCMATFFLRDAGAAALMNDGRACINFRTKLTTECWVQLPDVPEGAVCFDEAYVLAQYRRFGLQPDPVYHGNWCGRTDALSTHDVIVATRTSGVRLAGLWQPVRRGMLRMRHGVCRDMHRVGLGGLWRAASRMRRKIFPK